MFLTGESVSLAGLVATFIAQGHKGVSRLLKEALHVNAPIRWWLYALLFPQIWFVSAGIVYLFLRGSPIIFKPSALLAYGTPALLIPFFLTIPRLLTVRHRAIGAPSTQRAAQTRSSAE